MKKFNEFFEHHHVTNKCLGIKNFDLTLR